MDTATTIESSTAFGTGEHTVSGNANTRPFTVPGELQPVSSMDQRDLVGPQWESIDEHSSTEENRLTPPFDFSGSSSASIMEEDKIAPIAVIGMALKFPQQATSPDSFWQMLIGARSALTETPPDRFNVHAFYTTEQARGGMINASKAHFVHEDIAAFDAPFFSVSAEEAASMDPQQRLLLETTYQALENAGISLEKAVGSNTSVHIGSLMHDYETLMMRDPQLRGKHTAVGTAGSILANRLSWFYDLHGPSMKIDTACSSSLTAIHLACQGLLSGETDMGIVGGCNIFFDPGVAADIMDMGILSPDGVSYCFDRRANGYSRGEGIGIVVLKRLSDALESGDTIRAVIRATGVGSSGRTPGITQPSGVAQAALIRKVYERGGLDPATTQYFEAHGTGTPVGDLMEARAIHNGLDNSHERAPLYVGAVKSNIGHLEGAAGIAGFIKAVLVLEKGIIPPNLWFEQPNRKVLAEEWNLKFPTNSVPWPSDGLRRASQNSFGFGGANTHVIMDDAYNYLHLRGLGGQHRTCIQPTNEGTESINGTHTKVPSKVNGVVDKRPHLLVWSASDESGIKRIASCYERHFQSLATRTLDDGFLGDLSYTLSQKRSKLLWRSFSVVSSPQEVQQLSGSKISKALRSVTEPRLGFVFTGQGAQWPGMGKELVQYPTCQKSLECADHFFRKLGAEWSLLDVLRASDPSSKLGHPAYSQPICTALQTTLVDLLDDWSVVPSAAVGHSSGEIAAAYCVGAISRETAWTLAYFRGVVSAEILAKPGSAGSMMSVGLSEAEVQRHLNFGEPADSDSYVTVACVNSPRNVTLSGSALKLDALYAELVSAGVFARRLNVDIAYHSKRMESAASRYEGLINNIPHKSPCSKKKPMMISSVTGQVVGLADLAEPGHWVRSLTHPVKFAGALAQTLSQSAPTESILHGGLRHLIEIGPHSSLRGPIQDLLDSVPMYKDISYSSILKRGRNAIESALEAAGTLYSIGYDIDVSRVNRHDQHEIAPCGLVDLPPYPFNHSKTYWLEGPTSKGFRFRKHPYHELLGVPVSVWNDLEPRWRNSLSISGTPWVQDHQVDNAVVFPATGVIAMAIEGLRKMADPLKKIAGYRVQDVLFTKAIVIPQKGSIDLEVSLQLCPRDPYASTIESSFRIYTLENEHWIQAAGGHVSIQYCKDDSSEEGELEKLHLMAAQGLKTSSCTTYVNSQELYGSFKARGLHYGPSFQRMQNVHLAENEAVSEVSLYDPECQNPKDVTQSYIIHPAALDAIFQTVLATSYKGSNSFTQAAVISKVLNLQINAIGPAEDETMKLKVWTKAKAGGPRHTNASIFAANESDCGFIVDGSIEVTHLGEQQQDERSASNDFEHGYFEMTWKPDLDLLSTEQIKAYCARTVKNAAAPLEMQLSEEIKLLTLFALCKTHEASLEEDLSTALPHSKRYLDWIKQVILDHDCEDERRRSRWQKLEQFKTEPDLLKDSLERVASGGPAGGVLVRLVNNNIGILRGEVDALDLLFHDGLMTDMYSSMSSGSPAFEQLATYIDAFSHKDPDLRILEIGAGTGSATKEMLQTLSRDAAVGSHARMPRFSEYVFTDISPAFFEKAKERFREAMDRMKFAVLNIEQDPSSQGFQEGKYDMIVASNVLHATANLRDTLINARKLLKPGGKLILCEVVDPSDITMTFMFGILPGWWLSTEEERKWGPLLEEEGWNRYLSQSGFSGVDISFRDETNKQGPIISIMIATASGPLLDPTAAGELMLVLDQSSECQVRAADLLDAALLNDQHVPSKRVDLNELSSSVSVESPCIFLPEIERQFLDNISEKHYEALHNLAFSSQGIIWVSMANDDSAPRPYMDMAVGLGRVLRAEIPTLKFVNVHFQASSDLSAMIPKILLVYQRTFSITNHPYEPEYIERDGLLCINRITNGKTLNEHMSRTRHPEPVLQTLDGVEMRALKLDSAHFLQSGTVQFIEVTQEDTPLAADEIELEIKATGLDLSRRCEQAEEGFLSIECSGVVTQAGSQSDFQVGDRVCCLMEDAPRTHGRCNAATAVRIPDQLTFQEAAILPADNCSAYLALMYWGRLRAKESILIVGGGTGLDHACIRFAMTLTDAVYVITDNEEEKQNITQLFSIPGDCVLLESSGNLLQTMDVVSRGRGVDVIVAADGTEATHNWHACLAPFGRFLTFNGEHQSSSSASQAKNTMVARVDLIETLRENKDLIKEALHAAIRLFQERGSPVPSAAQVCHGAQLESALQSHRNGRSREKIVLEFEPGGRIPVMLQTTDQCPLDGDATYLIAGGLGGLGRTMALWMSARGAKHIVLLSRSGPQSQAAQSLVQTLIDQGTRVVTPCCDISNASDLQSVLAECARSMPPIRGCVNAAMAHDAGFFRSISHTSFTQSLATKVAGSWNLHTLLPASLTFFILLSSISGVVGHPKHANYSVGNTFQDALARYRTSIGLPGVTLDLNVMLDDGFVAENVPELADVMRKLGYAGMRRAQFETLLDYFCHGTRYPLPSVEQSQVVCALRSPRGMAGPTLQSWFWTQQPLMRHLWQLDDGASASAQGGAAADDGLAAPAGESLEAQIRATGSQAEVAALVLDVVRGKLASLFGIEAGEVDVEKPMMVYGMDSLGALGMATFLRKSLGVELGVLQLLDNTSIVALCDALARRCSFVEGEGQSGG